MKRKPSNFVKHRPSLPGDAWADPRLGEWTAFQKAARRSPETIKLRAPVVQKFAEEISVNPVSATSADIVAWLEQNPQWSAATARTYWSALSAWFQWLIRQEYRVDNPMLKLDTPPRPVHQPRPVSESDLSRLLSTRMHRRTRVMILLAALAGMRASEIAGLKGEDVDLAGRLLHVRCAKTRGRVLVIKTVPMHPLLAEEVAKMPAKGYWFPSRKKAGAPIQAAAVSATIGNLMRRAGVRGTPHALRHWFGTHALRACGDLRAVQTLMRHASVTSTEIYTEVAEERRSEVVDMLDPFSATRSRFTESEGREL